ncbi:MAG: acyl dehydratase [Pseudomonadales bacterium]
MSVDSKLQNEQRYFADIQIGTELPAFSIPITLQRLVMEAGSNRDMSLIHHDQTVAKATGAQEAYANTFFLMAMFERLAREWMGVRGRLKRIESLRMAGFNCVGDTITVAGSVTELQAETSVVLVDAGISGPNGETVTARLHLELPSR